MKITIEATDRVTKNLGLPCREWRGTTEAGTPCIVFIPRIAVATEHETAFERERERCGLVTAHGSGETPDGETLHSVIWSARHFR